jgi:hypothetical protein
VQNFGREGEKIVKALLRATTERSNLGSNVYFDPVRAETGGDRCGSRTGARY